MAFAAPFHPIDPSEQRRRALSVALVAAVHVLLAYILLAGLSVALPARVVQGLTLLDVLPSSPPPPVEHVRPTHARNARRQGAAAPPNLRAKATELVAPPPLLPVVVSPRVIAAPVAGIGAQAWSGAAPIRGPGSGAGGIGHGTGSGLEGDGDGNGDGGTPLLLISDGIGDSDYPSRAFGAGISGTVGFKFVVGVKGRVTDCVITVSSGNSDLDEDTCKLVRKKLRYRPATNASGRPVPETVDGTQVWNLYRRPEPDREWTE